MQCAVQKNLSTRKYQPKILCFDFARGVSSRAGTFTETIANIDLYNCKTPPRFDGTRRAIGGKIMSGNSLHFSLLRPLQRHWLWRTNRPSIVVSLSDQTLAFFADFLPCPPAIGGGVVMRSVSSTFSVRVGWRR